MTTNPQTDLEISDPHDVGQAHGCPEECPVHNPGGPDVQILTAPPATFAAVSVPAPAPTDETALRDHIGALLQSIDPFAALAPVAIEDQDPEERPLIGPLTGWDHHVLTKYAPRFDDAEGL